MPGGECLGETETLTRFFALVNTFPWADIGCAANAGFKIGLKRVLVNDATPGLLGLAM